MQPKQCINCDSPAIQYSDFCAPCENKELSKIGGFLYLPALGLVVSIFTLFFSAYSTMRLLVIGYDVLGDLRQLLAFEFVSSFIFLALCFYTAVLFFQKKAKAPLFYIIYLVAFLIYVITDLLLAHYVYDVKLEVSNYSSLFRTLVSTGIWVPYFIVSVRVKRIFIRR